MLFDKQWADAVVEYLTRPESQATREAAIRYANQGAVSGFDDMGERGVVSVRQSTRDYDYRRFYLEVSGQPPKLMPYCRSGSDIQYDEIVHAAVLLFAWEAWMQGSHAMTICGLLPREWIDGNGPRRPQFDGELSYLWSAGEQGRAQKTLLDTAIADLDFSVRTFNILDLAGIRTVGDLVSCTPHRLVKMRGCGSKCFREIQSHLSRMGLGLGKDPVANMASDDSRVWWREFIHAESPAVREKILGSHIKGLLRPNQRYNYEWSIGNDVRQLMQVNNPVTVLRSMKSKLEQQVPGIGTLSSPGLADFLAGDESVRIETEMQRAFTEAKLVEWLAKPPEALPDERGRTAIEVVWLGVPTEWGLPMLCYQLLVTSNKYVRKPRRPQGLRQLSNEVRLRQRTMTPVEARLLDWIITHPGASLRYDYGCGGRAGDILSVHGVVTWMALWGGLGVLRWADGSPVRYDPRDARLRAVENAGKLVWVVEFPADGTEGPADIVPFGQAMIYIDTLDPYHPDAPCECVTLRNGVLRPLDTGKMPLSVLSGLRSMPDISAERLRSASAAQRFANRYCAPPGPAGGASAVAEVRVKPTVEVRLENETAFSLVVRATSDFGDLFAWGTDGCWSHVQHPPVPVPEVESDSQPIVGEVGGAPADHGAESAAEPAAGDPPAGTLAPLAYVPSRADVAPLEEWLATVVPSGALYAVRPDGVQTFKWPAGAEAVRALLRNWPTRPAKPIYYGNQAFRKLVTIRQAPKFNIDIQSSGTDWLKVSVEMERELDGLSYEEAVAALEKSGDGDLVLLRGGRVYERASLEEYRRQVESIGALGLSTAPGPQRLHAMQVAAVPADELVQFGAGGDDMRRLAEESRRMLSAFSGIPAAPADPATAAFLRPYQRAGTDFVTWAARTFGGALLADDMGLGKTIQVLAALTALRNADGEAARLPSLVICPASVMHNWQREAGRFAPDLRVHVLERGAARARTIADADQYDILVTNQALARRDIESLRSRPWFAVVADEAQAIKNPDAAITRAVKSLDASYRIALTGTPVENRLSDIWSIIDFAVPGHLGSLDSFFKRTGGTGSAMAFQWLHARLRCVLLRRRKAEVAPELPDRIEERIDCEMTTAQRKLYLAEVKRVRAMLGDLPGDQIAGTGRVQMLTAITRLRQICCDPALLELKGARSGKVEELMTLLQELFEEGHKVLVFSQFVRMLEILHGHLDKLGVPLRMLTGSTTNRQALVDEFEADKSPGAFLISLKAGGTGLNLVSASHAVIFDPWWNPAVEAQAIDRTHRIGQNKTVVAFRLVTEGTIEERIMELQETKRGMMHNVLEEDSFNRTLMREDFEFLLK